MMNGGLLFGGQTEMARQRNRDSDSRRQADDAFRILPRWRYMICNISKHTSQQQQLQSQPQPEPEKKRK